ncbi:hypothetical protein [Staphylococcus ratti]|uniref:Uncharacterized protein n=1 Tax=Staphylococcus ratti TaxID=2892440 RepID=A0ABY3PBD6_9STAP|nr:hypothetical protein [Staphylococcus ratti]UEX89594.1 hypothetical protein LN051_08440 [Staphylococcus ratti]
MKTKAIKIALSSTLLLVGLAPTMNSHTVKAQSLNQTQTPEKNQLTSTLKIKIDKYVTVSNNKFILDSRANNSLTAKELATANTYITQSNNMISENNLIIDKNTKVAKGNITVEGISTRSAAKGVNSIKVYWWGAKVFLNSHQAEALKQAAIAGGSTGLGGMFGGIGGATAGAAIGGYLASIASNYPITRGIWLDYNIFTRSITNFGWQ